jgi:protein-tyrosine phosphatase
LKLTQNSKLKTQNLTTDYHCHLLPGLDDGPDTTEESLAMARALREAGYTTVYCTPHLIKGSFEADNAVVRGAVTALQADIDSEGIDLRLVAGREYYLDEFLPDHLKDPLPLGETRFILVEIPNHVPVDYVKESCYSIKCSGYTPLIAHPERCQLLVSKEEYGHRKKGLLGSLFNSKLFRPAVWVKTHTCAPKRYSAQEQNSEPNLLGYLQDIGCGFQGNLGSFAGLYGESVRRSAERLRKRGVYTHFGTDLHSSGGMAFINGSFEF